jgi:ubiquinone/menaquinone biosynthesis C-methylase UbiE
MNDNQKDHWDSLHIVGKTDMQSKKETTFAQEVNAIIPSKSALLEIGCGNGHDAAFFAKEGHNVIATDFSEVAIEKNKKDYREYPHLQFFVHDTSKKFLFQSNTFDAIYARLSLHYFTDKITKEVFRDIYRILKPNGFLCFLCKSVNDPLFGKGKKIEKNMYEKDHIRHFFSEVYAKECLDNKYTIKVIVSGDDIFYGKKSAYVKIIAQKK